MMSWYLDFSLWMSSLTFSEKAWPRQRSLTSENQSESRTLFVMTELVSVSVPITSAKLRLQRAKSSHTWKMLDPAPPPRGDLIKRKAILWRAHTYFTEKLKVNIDDRLPWFLNPTLSHCLVHLVWKVQWKWKDQLMLLGTNFPTALCGRHCLCWRKINLGPQAMIHCSPLSP